MITPSLFSKSVILNPERNQDKVLAGLIGRTDGLVLLVVTIKVNYSLNEESVIPCQIYI